MGPSRAGRVTVHYDRWTGEEIMRITYADHNRLDQIMAQGVAFHEGQLFGPLNQLVGVFAALSVIALSVTGAIMWWRRRPSGKLGVPAMPSDRRIATGLFLLIAGLCLFLPMAGVTLMIALLADSVISSVGRLMRKARV